MKKKLGIVALVLICMSMMAYGTIAYFTAEDTATNVIQAGNIKIQLLETAIPPDGGEPVPYTDEIDVMPGSEISKILQVKNVGDNEAYVRVRLDKFITLAKDITGEADLGLVNLTINTKDWTEDKGYFYYQKPLRPNEITEPLLTAVTFSPDMDNIYQNSTAQIKAFAGATQTANNGSNVFEAAGWPTE